MNNDDIYYDNDNDNNKHNNYFLPILQYWSSILIDNYCKAARLGQEHSLHCCYYYVFNIIIEV